MKWRERIVSDPDILLGKPAVKGTRVSVELILGWLANGWTHEIILASYPQFVPEDILAALAYTAEMMREERDVVLRKAAARADPLDPGGAS